MFENCISLKTLDLSNLDTSKVYNMMSIFLNCSSLTSLNLNRINTSSVTIFIGMFYNCSSLESLDLSSFDTSNGLLMNEMFFNCSSLASLDLSNFKTTKMNSMGGMFYECSKLKSLDLSNFDTSSTRSMNNLFSNCFELISLDISNFNTTKISSISEMFSNCNNLQYINMSNFTGIKNKNDSDLFNGVPENITYCFNNENEIDQLIEKLKFKKCSINDCSNDWKIKERKIIEEKSVCVYDCSEDEIYRYEFKKKCYNNCPEGTYLSNKNNKCIIICGEYLPFEKNEECVSNCSTLDFFNNICKINNQSINPKDSMIDNILNEIIDGSADFLLSKVLNQEKKDYLIKNNNTEIFHITSLYNQKNNEYKNISTIDIGECEDILKEVYKINSNETLILFKIDFFIEQYMIPITEYEIYNPKTKKELDLNYCNGTKIKIYSPVSASINEEYLYKYDPNSDYYKDKCYPYTSECGNDDTLEERKNEFNNNYLSLCESNCIFSEYNKKTQKVLCECPFKFEFKKLSEILNKKDKLLYYNFQLEIDNNSNTNSYLYNDYYTNNINSEINLITIKPDNLKECLFKELKSNKCEESVTYEDLINKKYFPLSSRYTISKVFDLFYEKLKNRTININKDEIIEGEDLIFQMTTTKKKVERNKISHIDFSECEAILKKQYGIETPLIIFMVDIKRNDTISTQVEYQAFNPNNYDILDLTPCENSKIDIYASTNMDSETYNLAKYLKKFGYDIFDSSDDFYNDICSTFTSYNDTDVILNDRRKDFYNSNITLCEDNCHYEEFDVELLKVKCKCDVKMNVKDITEVKFSPNIILENFYKLEKYANLKIIICYNQVFNLSKLKKNYGSYFMIIIGILFIITRIIIFITLDKKINGIIKNIITDSLSLNKKLNRKDKNKKKSKNEIPSKKLISLNKNKSSIFNIYKKSKSKNENNIILNNSKRKYINKLINNPNKKAKKKKIINHKSKIKNLNLKGLNKCSENSKSLITKKNIINSVSERLNLKDSFNRNKSNVKNKNINNIFIISNKINNYKNYFIIKNNKVKENEKSTFINKVINLISKDKRYEYFIDDELNSLDYKYALKIDTRSFCQIYYSLLKQNHLIIFTFFVNNDYNIFLLKFALFLLSFSLYFFMNAIFFKDESLHKIYEDQGKYNILYQIPQILYSTFVSQIISSLLEKLSLSQDEIMSIKEKYNLKKKIKKEELKYVIKYITIKCTLFFILSIILLFGFWYYLSAFCAVYYNTQIPLIKDNITSFATSMLYPFFLILLPVIFRINSLRYKIKCQYIFSKIIVKIIGIIN